MCFNAVPNCQQNLSTGLNGLGTMVSTLLSSIDHIFTLSKQNWKHGVLLIFPATRHHRPGQSIVMTDIISLSFEAWVAGRSGSLSLEEVWKILGQIHWLCSQNGGGWGQSFMFCYGRERGGGNITERFGVENTITFFPRQNEASFGSISDRFWQMNKASRKIFLTWGDQS